jgi:WXXGXW repeat (2 copies)
MRCVNAIRLLAIMGVMLGAVALPGTASAQVAVEFSVGFAPPPLPVYEQPICPGERYIWTPGYWAWDDDDQDYYWVPGTWVEAPEVGYLWTPGYWGWGGEAYVFHVGYWGPVVGFYGGIDYGWGYTGRGYYGGRWDHDHFYYNREVNHIDERVVRNVYNEHVENNVNITRVSYNGPNGGVNVRPTRQEEAAAHERHIAPVPVQNQHIQAARTNRELHASENRGKPPIAATARPAAFSGSGVVPARAGGNYNPPPNRGANNGNRGGTAANRPANENRPVNENRPSNNRSENTNPNRPPNASNRAETNNRPAYNHSNEVPRHTVPQAEPNANQKYQQQQEKLAQKQNQEHQKLQQQQEREHQQAQQQSANAARQQQIEQRHQQQTQQMEQRHEQQTQQMQQRQQPRQQAPPPRQNEEKKPH